MPDTYADKESPETKGQGKASRQDEDLLLEIRENRETGEQYWAENYRLGDEDMRCLDSETGPWPEEEIRARKDLNRPFVHIDICSQFNRRVINQAKLNPRGVVIEPQGSDADKTTAERRENRIRQIDHESNASAARQHALESAVNRGFGFYLVDTDFERPDSFDQKIITTPILDPKCVLFDPFCRQLDFSDMEWAFILKRYDWKRYRREFPRSEMKGFESEYVTTAPGWVDDKSVLVADYRCVKYERRTLLQLLMPEGPTTVFLDEFEDAKLEKDTLVFNGGRIRVLNQRETRTPKVKQYLTNGIEILSRKDWLGSTIPLIVLTGLRKYDKDGKLIVESLTRKLRAPQLKYDFAVTGEFEVLGMVPKSKWTAAVGQTEDFDEWTDANRNPSAVLRYKVKTEDFAGEQPLPPPERIDYDPPIQAYEIAQNSALLAAQQAAGMFSVERKSKVSESGRAIDKLNQEQDVGNYHFADYLDFGVQYEGRIKNEILRHIEDTAKTRGMRTADDQYKQEDITPTANPETGELAEHPYGKGRDHDVSVKAGPSSQSQWDKASDFLDLLTQNPQFAPLVMDMVIYMKQLGPKGDKLAERFEKMLPPHLREKKEGEPDPVPPEIQQAMQQMQTMIQALTQQLNEAKEQLRTKQNEIDAKIQIAQADNATKLTIEQMNLGMAAQEQQLTAFMAHIDRSLEVMMQGRQHSFDDRQNRMGDQMTRDQGNQQAQLTRESNAQTAQLQRESNAQTAQLTREQMDQQGSEPA